MNPKIDNQQKYCSSSKNYDQLDKELYFLETGFIRSRCLQTIIKLNIPMLIGDTMTESKTARELSNQCNVDCKSLFRLLRMSSLFGLFEMVNQEGSSFEKTKFKHSELSLLLLDEKRRNLSELRTSDVYYDIWKGVGDSIEKGHSTYPQGLQGKDFWEICKSVPETNSLFKNGIMGYTQSTIDPLLELGDYSKFKIIADIGGSHGLFLDKILKNNPSVEKGINFDLKQVLDNHSNNDNNQHDLKRYVNHPGSFFESVPKANLYILKSILHDWDDKHSCQILNTITKSCDQDSKIYIYDYVFSGDQNIDQAISLYDIHMFQVFNGAERTVQQFEELARNCDLKIEDIRRVQGKSFIQSLVIMSKK